MSVHLSACLCIYVFAFSSAFWLLCLTVNAYASMYICGHRVGEPPKYQGKNSEKVSPSEQKPARNQCQTADESDVAPCAQRIHIYIDTSENTFAWRLSLSAAFPCSLSTMNSANRYIRICVHVPLVSREPLAFVPFSGAFRSNLPRNRIHH